MRPACSVGAPGGARISSDFGCSPPQGLAKAEMRKGKPGRVLIWGQDCLHVMQMRFSPGRIRGQIQGHGVIVKDQN